MMLKIAYARGFQQAIDDARTEKRASFWSKGMKYLASQGGSKGGTLANVGNWALRNPLAAKSLTGAGVGGVVGGIGGDDGGFMRGALAGGAIGAGAHGGRLLGLGAKGRGARQALRTGKAMQKATVKGKNVERLRKLDAKGIKAQKKIMGESDTGGAIGAGLGAVGAGGAGLLGASALVPNPPPERPWYRRW